MSGSPAPIARLFGRRDVPRRRTSFVPTPLGPVALETRQLMSTATLSQGILTVTGTANADSITVADSGSNIVVDRKSFAKSSVTSIVVNGLGGKDTIIVASTKAATLNGGDGDDTLIAGSGRDILNGGAGNNSYKGTVDADVIVDPKLTGGVKMIKAIMDKYQSFNGSIGSPTSADATVAGVANGHVSNFQYGRVYWSPTTGAHGTWGMVMTSYDARGGPSGPLGLPTNEPNSVGTINENFAGGSIVYNSSQRLLHVLYGAFRDKYLALGGPSGFLGMPMQDQQTADPSRAGGDWCNLQGGTLVLAPNGQVYEVHGAILDKYYSLGGGYGLLGVPLSDEYQSSDGWRVSKFQYGTIMWRGDMGTHLLFNRDDVVAALKRSELDGVLDSGEFNYFKAIANDANVYIPDWVRYLTQKVINGDKANFYSQGQYVNNLYAGAPARSVDLLEREWFEGADHPLTNFVRTNSDGTWTTVNGGAYSRAAGPLFGPNGPVYTDVDQGNLGDCFLLASLAETAYRDPNSIRNMFIDNGDGTFTVRFFQNGSPRYVTVDRQLPMGGTSFAQASTGPIWVALAEKAYAQMNESGWMTSAVVGGNTYGALDGGKVTNAMPIVSGRSVESVNTSNIDSSWAAGKFVVLNTDDTKLSYLVPSHSYAVVGYNATTKLYTLFNPWGVNGGTMPDGTSRAGFIYELASSIKTDFVNIVQTKSASANESATAADRELVALSLADQPAAQPRFVRGGWMSRMWSTPLSA